MPTLQISFATVNIKIIFKTVGKVFSNADNANTTATVVVKPEDSVVNGSEAESSVVEDNDKILEVAITEDIDKN